MYIMEGVFNGVDNGNNIEDCSKIGLCLGVVYYVDVVQIMVVELGIDLVKGILMIYVEVEFLLAEVVVKGWIFGDVESYYCNGIVVFMEYYQVDLFFMQWFFFEDFYDNFGVVYEKVIDIWEQKWVVLFFYGLQFYFEL